MVPYFPHDFNDRPLKAGKLVLARVPGIIEM
jgi:hypothetical protein